MPAASTMLWKPAPQVVAEANMTAFAARVGARHGVDVTTYDALWRWSIDHKADFWREVWDDAGVVGTQGDVAGMASVRLLGSRRDYGFR